MQKSQSYIKTHYEQKISHGDTCLTLWQIKLVNNISMTHISHILHKEPSQLIQKEMI